MKRSALIAVVILTCALSVVRASGGELSPSALLPADDQLEGWKRDGEALVYDPSNLWEYINGQAEAFLMYDFIEVAAQHYLDEAELEIKIEIYMHGSPLMAFGIYSQLRSPDATYIELGNEAFGDDYSLHFWKGRFYVKVYAYDEGEESAAAMKRFAALVEGKILDEGGEPVETSLFPAGGLEKKSVTFVTEGVMGSGSLPPAFMGDYTIGEERGKLYIFSLDSAEAAAELFKGYAGELGAAVSTSESGGLEYETADGEAPYRGAVKLFAYGRFMGIVTGFAGGSEAAVDLAGGTVSLIDTTCRAKK
jgi:hypothetical protein